jgi:hypothetical protein
MTVATGASFTSLALDSSDRPHISYADAGTGKGAKLRYTFWDGKTWMKQAIPLSAEVIGYYTGIALDKSDKPTISFYEYGGPGGIFILRLRTVTLDGDYWALRTVDSDSGSGKFNAIAIDSTGAAHVAYANVGAYRTGLRYARWNGKIWDAEVLEGGNVPLGVYSVSIVLDKNNVPHIAYTDTTNKVVKYATRRGVKWQLQTVGAIAHEAYPDRNGIAVDAEGNPYISYHDAGSGVLKFAYNDGKQWITETVDGNGAGFTSSIRVHDGSIWITYAHGGDRALKCARRALPSRRTAPGAEAN